MISTNNEFLIIADITCIFSLLHVLPTLPYFQKLSLPTVLIHLFVHKVCTKCFTESDTLCCYNTNISILYRAIATNFAAFKMINV